MSSYELHDYVTHEGSLYRFITSHASGNTWNPLEVETVDMTDPDAAFGILPDGSLRLVAADGTVLWTDGYTMSLSSGIQLSCDYVNLY